MKQKLSDYISNFLVEKGIKDIFTVTGGGAMHLNDSFGHNKKLNCIYNHHEQACSIAAEGYYRMNNKLPAVCVTTGPGGTNAITGVYGAWVDSIPMFVISGQVKRETTIWSTEVPLRQLGDQEFNIVDCVSTMTKYSHMVTDANEIAYHLEKAYYLCKNGRPGPVWLDIPLDIQAAIIDTDELKHFDPKECEEENPIYDETLTDKIIEKIKQSRRPVFFCGSGIRCADAQKEFIKLAEKFQIPVVTAWNAHDTIWDDHKLYCGRQGTAGDRGGNFVVQSCDLLITFGSRLNIRQVSYNYKSFAKDAYKIVIDIDKAELDKPTISPDIKVHANVKDVINSLLSIKYKADNETHKKWLKWCKDINTKYPVVLDSYYKQNSPINPYAFMKELFTNLEENEKIVVGNGTACIITFQAAIIKKGQRLFGNSGCASMGYGLPAAIGAAYPLKGKRLICLDGDGSIQMNIQEFATLSYHKLNLKLFLLNNNGYHSIRQTQTNLFNPPLVGIDSKSGLMFPNYETIAKAYSIEYRKIDSLTNINEKIQEVLNTNGPIICEVFLDEKQFFQPKLSSKVLEDGTIVSPEIDDMFPFIDRKEYEKIKNVKNEI